MSDIGKATQDLQENVDRADNWVNGDENSFYEAKDGEKVPSVRNLNKRAEINIDESRINADKAIEAAKKAESSATASIISSGIFLNINDGLSKTDSGDYFSVISEKDSDYLNLYLNNSGVAKFVKSYPSSIAIYESKNQATKQVSGLSKELSFAPAAFFDDVEFSHVDVTGVSLNSPEFIGNISKNIPIFKKSPYLEFDDHNHYYHVDSELIPIDNDAVVSGDLLWKDDLYVEVLLNENVVKTCWKHDDKIMLQMTWGNNGHNGLFNFISIKKSKIGDPKVAVWENIQTVTTDYIPPLYFRALTGETSDSGTSSTGGNHGTNGGQGKNTAFMNYCRIYIDDSLVEEDFKGYLSSIVVQWENSLYAGNTVNEKRVCIIQRLIAKFEKFGVTVDYEGEATEKIEISMDGGTQVVGQGWNDSAHFYGGKNQGEQVGDATTIMQAGIKQEAPDCWATVLKSKELGYLSAWIDRSFGVKSDWVLDNNQMAFKNNKSWKFYQCAVRATDIPIVMEGGEKYRWRGGYHYSPISITNYNSAFLFKRNGRLNIGYAVSENKKTTISLPKSYAGSDFENFENILSSIELEFDKYKTGTIRER